MSDRDDIIDLAIAYTWALDTKQLDGLRDVFAPDATALLRGIECDGLESIIARISGAILRLDATQHLVGNHQVVVAGDTATHRCQLHSQHFKRDTAGGDWFVVGGHYEDNLSRTVAGWRITHRVMTETWRSGNPDVTKR